jgi:hypothetical protein
MSFVSHQTIRLSAGKHSSPEEGACVMELASMLAGESFTDHPACVCPVIGSFLRAYNDSVGDERRQDLYPCVSMVVGSLASAEVERSRAERLVAWSSENFRRRWARFFPRPVARVMSHMRKPPIPLDALGAHAVHSIPRHTDETHAAALELIEELVAIGGRERRGSPPVATERGAQSLEEVA